jgi:hypothetical protein
MAVLAGIQIGAISFVDEGVDTVLDLLADKAGVNALFIGTQAFDRGLAGRQVTRKPHPGHGGDHHADVHLGGSFVTQHEEFYRASSLGPHRAADAEVAGFDALGDVIPSARERDMKVYSFMLENNHQRLANVIPGWSNVLQVDTWGRTDPYACLRNPDYIAWWRGLVEDQVKSYELDGLMIGAERNGPLDNVLSEGGFARDGGSYCFCEHCIRAASEQGIDVSRAREGYLALDKLVTSDDSGEFESSFIRFLRLLGTYPELIAWDQFWHEGYLGFQAKLYGTIKFLAPTVQVGWHVWHHNSFSPWYRSQMDFSRIGTFSDFVKPVLYKDAAGYRLHHYVSTLVQRVFRGVSEQTVFDLLGSTLGYDENVKFDDLPALGLSADYVRRETARTRGILDPRVAVYPGLDVNIPAGEGSHYSGPEDVRASVAASLDGGANGFVLSRKYSEMTHENLEAVGAELVSRGLKK